jgi:hypothetical protein
MLTDAMKVLHIERLLAQGGLSQRQIARLAGVSHPTVMAIARGLRLADEEAEADLGPAVRCPSCGGRVFLPCRVCELRSLLARKKGPAAN